MHQILVVDDDRELCELLVEYLNQDGFVAEAVHDGDAVAQALAKKTFDLMVLDVMLPKKNGFDVLRDVYQSHRIPVLMLTAKGDEIDRILGLELGADDYLSKPCNPRELTARIRSILRRTEALPPKLKPAGAEKDIRIGDLELCLAKRQIVVGGKPIELTATEFQMVQLLVGNAGQLITREQISETCLGRKLMAFDRSIDMHISHLRKKLGETSTGEERIKTVRGTGYQYVAI